MEDEVKIEVRVSTNKLKSAVTKTMEVPKEEWDEMDDVERSDMVFEFADQHSMFEVDYEEV